MSYGETASPCDRHWGLRHTLLVDGHYAGCLVPFSVSGRMWAFSYSLASYTKCFEYFSGEPAARRAAQAILYFGDRRG